MVNLGRPYRLEEKLDVRVYRPSGVRGDVVIIPAGTPVEFRSRERAPQEVESLAVHLAHEVLRFMSPNYVTDATVTSVGPGRRLAFAGGEGTTVRGYWRVEEALGGERFVQDLEIRLSGPMRLLEPLLARLYACRMRLEARALKAHLERQDRADDNDQPLVGTRAALES
jgi:hypothetical protein